LLNCARTGAGRSRQAGKGHDLLAVGGLGKTDNRLGGGLMDACEQGQHAPKQARGSFATGKQVVDVSFHRNPDYGLLLQSESLRTKEPAQWKKDGNSPIPGHSPFAAKTGLCRSMRFETIQSQFAHNFTVMTRNFEKQNPRHVVS
jgi:hypothetical protein